MIRQPENIRITSMIRRLFFSLFMFLIFSPVFSSELSSKSVISLITMAPGNQLHSAFGHAAFRVYDPDQDMDILFNYGVFPFYESGFIPKFVNGKLDYLLEVSYFDSTVDVYVRQKRMVVEQVLNLNLKQRRELFAFLSNNARPENKVYRYDFLFDNCSTRLRDVLVTVLGKSLKFTQNPDPGLTFREMLDLYVKDTDPLTDFAFDTLLGLPTDRKVTPYEAMFLPDFLRTAFDHAVIVDKNGERPLVRSKHTLYSFNTKKKALPFFVFPAFWAWSIFIMFMLLTTILYWKRDRPSAVISFIQRIFDFLLLIAVGLIGLLLLYLWVISEHVVTNYNLNLLWANPLLFGYAFFLLFNVFKKIQFRFLQIYIFLPLVVVLGWFLLPQNFHPAFFPVSLTLLLRCAWNLYILGRNREKSGSAGDVARI